MILRTLLALWTSVARPMGDHLWQSTICCALAGFLALALRKNQARIRYWIWLTASVKFLIPFSLLISLGSHLAKPRASTSAQAVVYSAVEDLGQPFATQELPVISESAPYAARVSLLHLLPAIAVAVWLVGIIVVLLRWFIGWMRISLMLRRAVPVEEAREVEALRRLESSLAVRTPIRLVLSPDWMEPGIFGIFRPVLIWPEGISQHLDDRHIEAVLAHEVCHAGRRDNLTAVLHMLVEAVFWFHPLVWWMGARLEEERERSCDEEVSLLCNQPHVYAESILKVCKFCSESPLACVSGITGADLKKRIMQIMTDRVARKLDLRRKLLLAAAAMCVVAAPVMAGQAKEAHRLMLSAIQDAPEPRLDNASSSIGPLQSVPEDTAFEVASLRRNETGGAFEVNTTGDAYQAINGPILRLIATAYVPSAKSDPYFDYDRILGIPGWARTDPYTLEGKVAQSNMAAWQDPALQPGMLRSMMRRLLIERCRLALHRETRDLPLYSLLISKNGPKLKETPASDLEDMKAKHPGGITLPDGGVLIRSDGRMSFFGVSMPTLAKILAVPVGHPVQDRTGLLGRYDFVLQTNDPGAPSSSDLGLSIFTLLPEQAGLRVQPGKGQVEVLIVDHIEKPSAN